VVAGAAEEPADLPAGIEQVQELVADGIRLKDACSQVAEATGLSRRDLYEGTLAARATP
jgi:16S rRNA (cytidine1402-2'-O)-methyltransferase